LENIVKFLFKKLNNKNIGTHACEIVVNDRCDKFKIYITKMIMGTVRVIDNWKFQGRMVPTTLNHKNANNQSMLWNAYT
jgi:hypothetical protein